MSKLKVLLTGNRKPWELGESFRRGFDTLGHEVELFDWYGRVDAVSRSMRSRVARQIALTLGRRTAGVQLIAAARRMRPDLICILKTDDLPLGAIGALRAAAPGTLIMSFHPDDPFRINRWRGPSHPRSLYVMRAVDHYFLWSERLLQEVRNRGARAASYLGFACDPEFTRPLDVLEQDRARFGADVSFVGNWDEKREDWLTPIAHLPNVSLAIWGGSAWRDNAKDDRVRACWRGNFAFGDDLVRAIRCSRIALNVLRVQNEGGENMRTYEVPACGGLLLAESSPQQQRVFLPSDEAFYASSPEHMAQEVRRLLAIPDAQLEDVRRRGLKRAERHTYMHRAAEILARFGYGAAG